MAASPLFGILFYSDSGDGYLYSIVSAPIALRLRSQLQSLRYRCCLSLYSVTYFELLQSREALCDENGSLLAQKVIASIKSSRTDIEQDEVMQTLDKNSKVVIL